MGRFTSVWSPHSCWTRIAVGGWLRTNWFGINELSRVKVIGAANIKKVHGEGKEITCSPRMRGCHCHCLLYVSGTSIHDLAGQQPSHCDLLKAQTIPFRDAKVKNIRRLACSQSSLSKLILQAAIPSPLSPSTAHLKSRCRKLCWLCITST